MPDDRHIDALPHTEPIEVVIDDYGYTGEGYVRLADGWLSVRGAMPGERVRVRLEGPPSRRSRRRWAELVEVLKPHPQRRDPLCARDRRCRGCQLRHLSIAEETRFKARTIREVLDKYAAVAPDDQPPLELIAPEPWMRGDAWRVRSAMTYRSPSPQTWELGLRPPTDAPLIEMQSCPALTEPARRLIDTLQQTLAQLAQRGQLPPDAARAQPGQAGLELIRAASPVHGRGMISLEHTDGRAEPIHELARALAERVPAQVGISSAHEPGARVHHAGPEAMILPVAGLRLEVGPEDWFHATLTPAHLLYDRLMAWLAPLQGQRLLDVGCGIGTIALLAARRGAHTLGLDARRSSIERAELHALTHELERARFEAGSWESGLRRIAMRGERFDVATINPMREPLGPRALAYLRPLGPERLVYLGPSPAAAARDLGTLREQGWQLERAAAAMLHPATYHVMLVAQLGRATLDDARPPQEE